ncbi:MAG: hypothetical protein ABJH63_02440 [Rhizobiaceae bacterium]
MKQGPSRIVGKFLFLLVLLAALTRPWLAYAQSLHFVSVAWVLPNKQAEYDLFNERITAVWARYGMEVLLRGRVIGALAEENPADLPTEIAVLRVASRTQFQDYIADPTYRQLRPDRMNAIEQMTVLEGTVSDVPLNSLVATAPQFAIKFSNPSSDNPDEVSTRGGAVMFRLSTSHVGSIKGPMAPLYASKPHITLFAMSYDDNPMGFADETDSASSIFILQRVE